jgi:F420-dependent oxidoreductase-like protein
LSNRIRFGVTLPTWDYDVPDGSNREGGRPVNYDEILNIAFVSEKLGYYSILVDDHLTRGKGGFIYEGWTILSALSAITSKIRLGTIVLCNSFRYPSVLAKMASTLDVISKGRLELAMGAGWMQEEYVQYGIPFPVARERIGRLKEGVEIIRRLWTEDSLTYRGKYYTLENAICEPKPVQKPHPPIWIGGGGEHLTLRVVAESADGCNFGGSFEEYKHKLEVLKKHCSKAGKDFRDLEKSWIGNLIISLDESDLKQKMNIVKPQNVSPEDYANSNIVGTPEQCIDRIKEYSDFGITYFVFNGFSMLGVDDLKLFAEEVMHSL